MQYMLLIYEPERAYEGADGEARLSEIVARHMALAEELQAAGAMVGGEELKPTATATTVATGAGGAQSLHDGPFAETREQLGGFYIVEAADLDAAIAWARKVPVVEGGKIEVRPVNAYEPSEG
jgi:hypothetical protein